MTAQERSDAIAKTLYMGMVPDIWTMMAQAVVMRHLEEAWKEGYEAGKAAQKNRGD
jgi:hypothetical protein